MFDEMIVEFCSPTLAGIKTGNLFSYEYCDYNQFVKDVRRVNIILLKKGIELIPIRCLNHRALIYIFRPSFLEKDFCDKDTSQLLKELGYDTLNAAACVRCLSNKINTINSSKEFPHEIGLFLGYPVEDVKGFIKYKGECSKCIGCWKVYGDVMKAEDTFDRYKKCTNDYMARFKQGTTLDQLAVCA
ncbi:Protein of unknown function [Lachnospiraceae bacterium]|nr:Protein of unknown function [Lachnospiraceae bacterium]